MAVLVAGIGYIGAQLVRDLLTSGEEVVGVDNLFATDALAIERLAASPRWHFVRGNFGNPRVLAEAFAQRPISAVYCLAAQASAHPRAATPRYTESSNLLAPRTLLEAMAALHLSTGVSGISGGLVAKLYMDPWMLGEIALEPFLGAGAGVAIISVGLFGTTTTIFGVGVSGLGGLEYTFPDTPFSVFAEIGLSVSVLPSIGFGPLVDLGIRFDFPASVEAPL